MTYAPRVRLQPALTIDAATAAQRPSRSCARSSTSHARPLAGSAMSSRDRGAARLSRLRPTLPLASLSAALRPLAALSSPAGEVRWEHVLAVLVVVPVLAFSPPASASSSGSFRSRSSASSTTRCASSRTWASRPSASTSAICARLEMRLFGVDRRRRPDGTVHDWCRPSPRPPSTSSAPSPTARSSTSSSAFAVFLYVTRFRCACALRLDLPAAQPRGLHHLPRLPRRAALVLPRARLRRRRRRPRERGPEPRARRRAPRRRLLPRLLRSRRATSSARCRRCT